MMLLVLLGFLPTVCSQCYWNNQNPYSYFGCKTSYDDVRGDIRNVTLLEGCDVISVWLMSRHGARYPNQKDVNAMKVASKFKDDIVRNHALGKGELCAQDIVNLKNWKWNDNMEADASDLTEEGYRGVRALGRRFQKKFSTFLKNVDNSFFRSTFEKRTQKSVKAFVEGLQETNKTFTISPSLQDDLIARPYRYCRKRGTEVINATTTRDQIQMYQKTPEFHKTFQIMRNRTGISDLEISTMISFYNLCRYYRSASPLRRDPWCSLFTDEQLKTLEYVDDIKHYYGNGYGNKYNVKLGEIGLKDLYNKFSVASDNHTSITGYFTHGAMMDMIYSAMGLYKDNTISGLKRVEGRKWRKSLVTPFGANFIAVLYRCSNSNDKRVQFIINEKEIQLCKTKSCSWRQFQRKFEPFLHSDLKFCNDTK